ncbi:30S ribosomal protein S1 homolog [uncultured Clostridium sp.]|mgnify:CR=1 FL=1|nr:30S ribosomal protein S1 homolog [uncultured Clostridium sp.]
MSEELLQNEAATEETTPEETKPEEATPEETMADLEEHFDDANPWNLVKDYMEKGTILPVKVEGIVNGGAIAMVEGLRGFIPASKLSLSYIEDLETYLLKDIEVRVIDVNQAENRLVLSAREILKEKAKKEMEEKIANVKVGTVMEGKVESLQNYGAFVRLEDGLSGLVHVSQISQKRVKSPKDVLNVGDEVKVKVIGIKDGKISLSMKALEEVVRDEPEEKVVIPKSESIGTSLGDLFKNIKL